MTVESLGELMSAREFEQWRIIYELEHEDMKREMKRAKSGSTHD